MVLCYGLNIRYASANWCNISSARWGICLSASWIRWWHRRGRFWTWRSTYGCSVWSASCICKGHGFLLCTYFCKAIWTIDEIFSELATGLVVFQDVRDSNLLTVAPFSILFIQRASRPPQDRTMVVACLAEVAQDMGAPIAAYVDVTIHYLRSFHFCSLYCGVIIFRICKWLRTFRVTSYYCDAQLSESNAFGSQRIGIIRGN